MRFKSKELMIQIVHERDIGNSRWGGAGGCDDVSCSVTCVYCTNAPSDCQVHGSVPVYCFDSGAVNPNPLDRLAGIVTIKAALQQHLAALEAIERATTEDLGPQTRAQVEQIERDLQMALDDVRATKATLPRVGQKTVRRARTRR